MLAVSTVLSIQIFKAVILNISVVDNLRTASATAVVN